jgi:hypothetical protein
MRLVAVAGLLLFITLAMQARGIGDLWLLIGPALMMLQALPVLWKGR